MQRGKKNRRNRLPTPVFLGFPCGSASKESACNAGDLGLIPCLGRSPGEGNGYPLQYSGPENSTSCIVHGVTMSWTRLSDIHFHYMPSSTFILMVSNFLIPSSASGKTTTPQKSRLVLLFFSKRHLSYFIVLACLRIFLSIRL